MMFVATATKTMQGARQIVQDNEPQGIPHRRAAIIDLAKRWQAEQARRAALAVSRSRIWPQGKGMPEWAMAVILEVATVHDLAASLIVGRSRAVKVVQARNEVFYRLLGMVSPVSGLKPTTPQVAAWFGRDPTAIMWGAARHGQKHGLPPQTKMDVARKMRRNREWFLENKA